MEKFSKKDLKNGDFVVLKNNSKGIYLSDTNSIIYLDNSGFDFVEDNFNDDLTSTFDGPEFDVWRVYRGDGYTPLSAVNYKDDSDIVFDSKYSNKDSVTVMVQAFYGNRTVTYIDKADFDMMMLGCLSRKHFDKENTQIDRTVVKLPNCDDLAVVYNKFQEEKSREFLNERKNPLCVIPEMNLTLYSRCMLVRFDNNGEIISLRKNDGEYVKNYFAK